jgi:hypothetical protein
MWWSTENTSITYRFTKSDVCSIKLSYLCHLLLKCLYQTRKVIGHTSHEMIKILNIYRMFDLSIFQIVRTWWSLFQRRVALSNVDIYVFINYSNITSFFRFVNKRASYPFGINSLAHAVVNVTDFSIASINSVRHFPQV